MLHRGSTTIDVSDIGSAFVPESNVLPDFPVSDTSHSLQYFASLLEASRQLLALGVVASIDNRGIYVGIPESDLVSLGTINSATQGDLSSPDPLLGVHSPLVGGFGNDDLLNSAIGAMGEGIPNMREQDVVDSLTQLVGAGAIELFEELSAGLEEAHEVQQTTSAYVTPPTIDVADRTDESLEDLNLPNFDEYLRTGGIVPDETPTDRPHPNLISPQLVGSTEQEPEGDNARAKRVLLQGARLQMNIEKFIPGVTDQGPQLGGITPAAIVATIILTTSGVRVVKEWLSNHRK